MEYLTNLLREPAEMAATVAREHETDSKPEPDIHLDDSEAGMFIFVTDDELDEWAKELQDAEPDGKILVQHYDGQIVEVK